MGVGVADGVCGVVGVGVGVGKGPAFATGMGLGVAAGGTKVDVGDRTGLTTCSRVGGG